MRDKEAARRGGRRAFRGGDGGCEKLFEEAACTTEITNLAAWNAEGGNGYIAPIAHTWSTDYPGKDADNQESPDSGNMSGGAWLFALCAGIAGCAVLLLKKKRRARHTEE